MSADWSIRNEEGEIDLMLIGNKVRIAVCRFETNEWGGVSLSKDELRELIKDASEILEEMA